jgi:hypothetical protein
VARAAQGMQKGAGHMGLADAGIGTGHKNRGDHAERASIHRPRRPAMGDRITAKAKAASKKPSSRCNSTRPLRVSSCC